MEQIVIKKFQVCYDIFSNEAFDPDNTPKACSIHDAFEGHNCIACNLADSSLLILKYLHRYRELDNIQQDFSVYILLLYLAVERIETILDILQVPEKYRDKYFQGFQQIRKWANFIKHPKSFILTHHPTYDFHGSGINHPQPFSDTIDDSFVERFYKGKKDPEEQKKLNKELLSRLKNKPNVLVIFPDIAVLTKKFCFASNKLIELIKNNEVFKDILTDEATIMSYFENEE